MTYRPSLVFPGDITLNRVNKKTTDLVMRREEATDPTALPASVGHEGWRADTVTKSTPVLAPRVLVMTPRLRPAAGVGAGLHHEVEHVLAEGINLIQCSVKWKMCVKSAGSSILPLGAEVSLILHHPRSS